MLACFALACAACNAARETSPRLPTLIVSGNWRYIATQSVGVGNAYTGILTIATLPDSAFRGSFDGSVADSLGETTAVEGTVAGTQTDTTSISFTLVTRGGDTTLDRGTLFGDTLEGNWASPRATIAGSFEMIRKGGMDDTTKQAANSIWPRSH